MLAPGGLSPLKWLASQPAQHPEGGEGRGGREGGEREREGGERGREGGERGREEGERGREGGSVVAHWLHIIQLGSLPVFYHSTTPTISDNNRGKGLETGLMNDQHD